MAVLAKGLPVCFIPKQLLVTTVWDDVIYHRGGRELSLSHTFRTQRMLLEERFSRFAPAGIISASFRAAAHAISRKLNMLGTVNDLVAQIRTARIATGAFWRFWHFLTSPV